MKKLLTTKSLFAFTVLLVVLSAGIVVFRVYGSPISFAYYEPSYLPPGVSITEKRISIIDDGKNRSESASLRLEKTAWTYSINQFELRDTSSIGESSQNYDAKSIKPTCSIFETAKGTEFRLCHWVDDWESHGGGEISVYEIKFIKGTTFFWGRIPSETGTIITVDDISRFIDSFERKSTDGVPIKRSKYWV